MTTQTIALLGGVVVLLLALVVIRVRRAKAEAAPAPSRVGDVADFAAPAPAAIPGPARLSAAEGVPAADPAPAEAPVAQAAPPAAEPLVVPQSWSSDELVREPGWLMPGEVDNVWQADFAAAESAPAPEAAAVPAGAVNGVAHTNGHAASAPDMGALVEGAIGGFDPAAGWGGATTVELDRPEPAEEPRIPQWDPVEEPPAGGADPGPHADLAVPAWSEEDLVGWGEPSVEPDVEAWAAPVAEVAVEPIAPEDVVTEPVAEEPVVIAPAPEPAEDVAAWPAAGWAVEAPEAPEAVEAPAADEPVVAWWDEVDEVEEPAGAAAPADVDAGTGRFALGGFALQPGHEAVAGVTFRAVLPAAPSAWAVDPDGEVAPGTLVLSVDGAVNTGAEEVSVLMDEGFAPSVEGFTVRAAARAAGPFAVSGTFRVS